MTTAMEWITSHDTGSSSKAIWSHMMTGKCDGSHPHDPDDFGRCYRLLLQVPEWRSRIIEMAKYSRVWAELALAWDELSTMYEAVVSRHDRRPQPEDWNQEEARRMYDRMKVVIDAGYVCVECGKGCSGAWQSIKGQTHCWECGEKSGPRSWSVKV